jgi:hypothetical protein
MHLHLQIATPSEVRKTNHMQAARENSTTTVTTDRPTYSLRAEQAVWLLAGIVDALLVIRFAFKLLGASTQASFVTFTYNLTQVFVAPFHGIFNTSASGGNVFEPESLVAIVIYSLIGWGLARLVRVTTHSGTSAS